MQGRALGERQTRRVTDIDELRCRAEQWTAADPEPAHSGTVRTLLDRSAGGDLEATQALVELFDGRVAFGTAGLRAPLGPGPRRMNRLVVRQTTAGLMAWLGPDALVVVGYDARHGSAEFAADVAAVVTGAGGRAEVLPRPLPTPVLAAAVLSRNADAGVMITASHNPALDNGYKLYLADGIQLVPPADAQIAAAISAVAGSAVAGSAGIPLGPPAVVLGEDAVEHHLELAVAGPFTSHRAVTSAYTPLHGVGGEHLLAAMQRAGFRPPAVVEEQFRPDPTFPTVAFPNPEEPGALDAVLALAASTGADVALANDPDADRLAVAIPARSPGDGFVALSGDQLGVLLADHILRHTEGPRQVATSLVSSRLLSAMAPAHDVRCHVTLTGFKWVARPAVDFTRECFVFGYEEAMGYAIGRPPAGLGVRDKDGITAALVALEMVADALSHGETLWDRLDRLDREFGVHRSRGCSFRIDRADSGSAVVAGLLASPPEAIGSARLAEVIDLNLPGGDLPPTDGALLIYDDDTRVIVRPSGTEPKVKAYLEARLAPGDGGDGRDQAEAVRRLDLAERVVGAVLEP